MKETLVDAWRRLGPLGSAGRLWARSFGWLADVRFVLEWELDAKGTRFEPLAGFLYEKAPVDRASETARSAAKLLGVRLAGRLAQDLFVARDSKGRVAACTWNDPPQQGRARQRGVAVVRDLRGRSLGGSLLLFQASELACRGVTTILYRTEVGNRASRRMFERIGARLSGVSSVFVLFGRRRAVHQLQGRFGALLRRRWGGKPRQDLHG